MNPIQQQIEQNEREFEEKVNQLRREVPDTNEESDVFEFGYKINVSDTLYTIADWGNIKSHLHQSQLSIIKAVIEEVEGMKVIDVPSEIYERYPRSSAYNLALSSLITRLNELLDNK